MSAIKFFFTILAVLFLSAASFACSGKLQNHASTYGVTTPQLQVNDLDITSFKEVLATTTESETLASDENVNSTFNSLLNTSNLITRDNTRVEKVAGLFGFFKRALTKVAVWGGMKLYDWVRSKIERRASTYERYYNLNDSGVIKAKNHWGDLLNRSGCQGREPDHNVHKAGFQGTDECPICSKQLNDLKTT